MYPYREMLCLRIESLLQAAAGDNIFSPRAVHGDAELEDYCRPCLCCIAQEFSLFVTNSNFLKVEVQFICSPETAKDWTRDFVEL